MVQYEASWVDVWMGDCSHGGRGLIVWTRKDFVTFFWTWLEMFFCTAVEGQYPKVRLLRISRSSGLVLVRDMESRPRVK